MDRPGTYREIAIDDLLAPLAGRDVAFLPNNGNLGDALIHAATLQVLGRLGVGCRLLSGDDGESGDVLLLGGGGNLVDRYDYLLPRLERLHASFRDVIILPHTIFGPRVAKVFAGLGPNVRVVCRERRSYDFLGDVLAHPGQRYLAHDMAFHFDYEPYRTSGTGVLNAFRLDSESTQAFVSPDNVDLSDAVRLPGRPYHPDFWLLPYWREYLDAFMARIGASAHVRTNRLHVAIAAGLLGKTVEMFDNDYYKNRAVYDYSLAARCPGVRFVPATRPTRAAGARPASDVVERRIVLHSPEVGASRATFRFDVDPPSPLYHATSFSLEFPPWIDLRGLPDRLWWTVFLLCLHAQWPYLAPCEVRLPVRLGPGELEFWRRLVASYLDTLEAHRTGETPGREIELVDEGPLLAPFTPLADAAWCATSFSGGKDSLLQVGLLTELTERPLLVTTTSPRPDLSDQSTPRRRYVLSEIGSRRAVTLVEVTSDLRATWENHYPFRVGYPVSVNETSDAFLYLSALLVVSMALGATHLFLASETEVQQNAVREGRIVQHPHFMYSAATQRALSAWLAPAGVTYGSLTWPLHSAQVLKMLWTRYPDLADLQYSCWKVGPDEAACSRCGQCFRIALGILAAGGRPERVGIDLPSVLEANAGWAPGLPAPADAAPRDRVRSDLDSGVIAAVQATSPAHVLCTLALGGPRRLGERRTWAALAAYRRLRQRLAGLTASPPRYQAGFLRLVDGLVRDGLGDIYAAHFLAAPEASRADVLARSEALTRWIVEPLVRATDTVPS
jgi:exopolysaccharide biosynthesis predicted pyruvyltransferase EpsI